MVFDKQRLPGARPSERVSTADIVGRREGGRLCASHGPERPHQPSQRDSLGEPQCATHGLERSPHPFSVPGSRVMGPSFQYQGGHRTRPPATTMTTAGVTRSAAASAATSMAPWPTINPVLALPNACARRSFGTGARGRCWPPNR